MSLITAVGLDVSKGKSTIAAMRPAGEVVIPPLDVEHSISELTKLSKKLLLLEGEVRIVMEYTGAYYLPIAQTLMKAVFLSALFMQN